MWLDHLLYRETKLNGGNRKVNKEPTENRSKVEGKELSNERFGKRAISSVG